jgi:tetratricopeptide (TPR) repeat protein
MTAVRHIIGASIPRSGHHFLASILKEYFSNRIRYCEFYTPKDCCKKIPCERSDNVDLTFQKNHDFDFRLDQNLSDVIYIVQYRHPTFEAASDWELARRNNIDGEGYIPKSSTHYFSWWLANKANYYKRFYNKWFKHAPKNSIIINYDDLRDNTLSVVSSIIKELLGEVGTDKVRSAIERASPIRATMGTRFVPRELRSDSFPHVDVVGSFENYVLNKCPDFNFQPIINSNQKDDLFRGLMMLLDQDEPIPSWAENRLDAVVRLAPDHPEVRLYAAKALVESLQINESIKQIEELLQDFPRFMAAWELYVRVCRENSLEIRTSLISSDTILASAGKPQVAIALARSLLKSERPLPAALMLQIVVGFHPNSVPARALLLRALSNLRRPDLAVFSAQALLALDPTNVQAKAFLERFPS